MRSYEIVYILRPDLTDQDVGTIRSDFKNRIETLNGQIEKENPWGKRQLAFEIKDFTEGIYTHVECNLPPEVPSQLKDHLKIDERVIRYMITVKEAKKPKKENEKRGA